jgi:predicted transcriptional regulator of viral defense system
MNKLQNFGTIPIDYNVLATTLNKYQSVKDKVSHLEKQGIIIRLKKGLYVLSPEKNQHKISRELVANHLYGPSYISLENALSHYGLIPEKVYLVRSVTTKRAKYINTQLGDFDYTTVPNDYYSIGIRQEIVNETYAYLIASPEKAICDMIVSNKNHRIQSVKAMQAYLEEDLRIEPSAIKTLDKEIIKQCIATNIKKKELTHLLKLIEK